MNKEKGTIRMTNDIRNNGPQMRWRAAQRWAARHEQSCSRRHQIHLDAKRNRRRSFQYALVTFNFDFFLQAHSSTPRPSILRKLVELSIAVGFDADQKLGAGSPSPYFAYGKRQADLFLLLSIRGGSSASARLQGMLMIVATEYSSTLFLRANLAPSHPLVFEYLIKSSAFLGINLQHSADNVPALAG